MSTERTPQIPLYRRLADEMAAHIRQQVYKPGDKLASVRALAKQRQVSVATVVQAYATLEEWDLIEARPKSGYYVRTLQRSQFAPPRMQQTTTEPDRVTTSQLVMDVMGASAQPGMVSLGAAIPATDFAILHQLKRCFAHAVRSTPFLGVGYDSHKGNPALRRQIARRALEAGVQVNAEEVVITAGCQGAMALCLRVLCQPGDIVAVESPAYYGLLQLIESLGLKAIEIPADARHGMSLDALRLALEQWPIKAILAVPSFSNPLGSLMPEANKRALVGLMNTYDVPLIEDDIYGDLSYSPQRPPAVKAFDTEGRVLLCSSVSKILEPQLGIGWIVPGRYLQQIEYERFLNSSTQFRLPQVALAEVMAKSSFDRHLRTARDVYRQRRDRLYDLIAQYFPAHVKLSQPQGGFVAWLQLPDHVDATQLYLQAKARGVLTAPGEIFSSNPQKYRHSLRISYSGDWTRERCQAIATLGQLLKQIA